MRTDAARRTLQRGIIASGGGIMSAINDTLDDDDARQANGATYEVGYRRPPLHTRFQPGKSGNPSGRVKGSKNLKTLFHQILNEQIPLIDGTQSKKVRKGEALMRRLIIGALKGDSRSLMTLMRIAEQTGEFEGDERNEQLTIRWVE
jgi:hypothetical protein